MGTTTVSTRMIGLLAMFDLQTPFLNSALDGLTDKEAHDRLGTKANHIAWLAGTLVQQRYDLAGLYGGSEDKQAAHDLFKDNQGIKDDVTYPSLESFKKDWAHISPIARAALVKVTDEKLDSVFEMPGMSFPHFDMITFTLYREANCIGQIALYRRLLGHPGMKYM